jgi:5-methylcytosine-specific restriction endonuclease McrA
MRTKFNSGIWTQARFNSFITSTLRAGARRWQPKYDTLNSTKTEKKINPASGRLAQHFRCSLCFNEVVQKEMEVDHIKPAIDPKKGFISWDSFINNLFCEKENLQAICKVCHKEKTLKEKQERVFYSSTKKVKKDVSKKISRNT